MERVGWESVGGDVKVMSVEVYVMALSRCSGCLGWGGDVLRERVLGSHAMDELRTLSIIEVMGRHDEEKRSDDVRVR